MTIHVRTAEALRKMEALIRQGWIQRGFARNANGVAVRTNDPTAVCWCASGVVSAVIPQGSELGLHMNAHWNLLIAIGDGSNLIEWNDKAGRTHAEVIDLFVRAVALAEEVARLPPLEARKWTGVET